MNKIAYLNNLKAKLNSLPNYSPNEEKLLVCSALKISQEKLFLMQEFSALEIGKIQKVLARRIKGEPLNKIFHTQNFYGRNFYVNRHVLSPRKETELVVEQALNIAKNIKNVKILDMCSGSGAIGLTLAKELPFSNVVCAEISLKATMVAKKNQKNLSVQNVEIVQSDMFSNVSGKFDIIVCNPPYIPSKVCKTLDISVLKFDPKIALDGGNDGLKFYKILSSEGKKFLKEGGAIVMEIGFDQKKEVVSLFEKNKYNVWCLKDYSNCDRIVIAKGK